MRRSAKARSSSPPSWTASANPNEADDYVAEEDFDEFDEADDDDGKGGSKALTKQARRTQEARRWSASTSMRDLFEKVHKIYDKEGYGTPART